MFNPSATRIRFRTDTGEDLPRLARLAYDSSQRFCGACRNYHTIWPYLRSRGLCGAGPETNIPLQSELLAKAAGGRETVRWLSAGAADSGMFNLMAKAAERLPDSGHTFTVVDWCETPLGLCRDHAAATGLPLETVRGDLLSFDRRGGFDVVVMHALLKFFSTEDRPRLLRQAAEWLVPGGMLCLTVQDEPPEVLARKGAMKAWRAEMLRADAVEGGLDFPENLESVLTRMLSMNRHRPATATQMPLADYLALVAASGFEIVGVPAIPNEDPQTENLREGGPRYMILARRP